MNKNLDLQLNILSCDGRISFRVLLSVLLIATFITIGLVSWAQLYSQYLEVGTPTITVLEMPNGVSITGATIKIEVSDIEAGLDEVIVRSRQRGNTHEWFRKPLQGQKKQTIEIPLSGQQLEEGAVEFEIKAFDRTLWSNGSMTKFSLPVDYHKPRLECLSSQHNARVGGSQLIFYKASDNSLAVSGVKVGQTFFPGYPASSVDPAFTDRELFAALYAIDIRQPVSEKDIRLYAEDKAGNVSYLTFYNHVQDRAPRPVSITVSDEFVNHTAVPLARRVGRLPAASSDPIEALSGIANDAGRHDDVALAPMARTTRFESFWTEPFLFPPGSVQTAFGDSISFVFNKQPSERLLQLGYQVTNLHDVPALGKGVVTFSEGLSVMGRTLGIDHGLGLTSLYGHLEEAAVRTGETVNRGQRIGTAGTSGLARTKGVFIQLRLNGLPVDPNEWWSPDWYNAHITEKIVDLKRALGIPVYRAM